jgi:hypothetical protein
MQHSWALPSHPDVCFVARALLRAASTLVSMLACRASFIATGQGTNAALVGFSLAN